MGRLHILSMSLNQQISHRYVRGCYDSVIAFVPYRHNGGMCPQWSGPATTQLHHY